MGSRVLFGLGICLGIQWWLEAIGKPDFAGLQVPDSTPVSAPHSDWPLAIFRLLALLRSPPCAGFFVAALYAVDLRAFDLRGRGFPLRVAGFSR